MAELRSLPAALLSAARRRSVRLRGLRQQPDEAAVEAARITPGDRLLEQPVFILSSIRSGSTLLRVMLNTHPLLHAPHELHLGNIRVELRGKYADRAMEEIDLDTRRVQYLLWDRLLHRELVRHGKQILVNKTPGDVLMWRRIVECWPDVRFIFLLRHPAAVTDSWQRARKDWTREETAADVLRYLAAVEDARTDHPGLTVRYEDLTRDPQAELRRICAFIGVEFDRGMVDYGSSEHGRYRPGLGDWTPTIRSGKVRPVGQLPPPQSIPPALLDISRAWGYVDDPEPGRP